MTMPRIYLAGPEVFLPDAIPIGERKKALCVQSYDAPSGARRPHHA